MTGWLAGENAPAGFTIDRELELRATGESKATFCYANHALEGEKILAHIAVHPNISAVLQTMRSQKIQRSAGTPQAN